MAFDAFDGPLSHRPKNLAEVVALFGDPMRGGLYRKVADPAWEKRCLAELHGEAALLPRFSRWYWKHHALIDLYMREAFARAELVAPGYALIERGTWSYNFRHMRHDPSLPLSFHSYGIAVDINSDDNRAIEFKAGKTPERWSPAWKKLWPKGVSAELVAAFKSCGFAWGGDWNGYCDPMHFEWKGGGAVQV